MEWTKQDDPSKGFQYIYLDDMDYQLLVAQANLTQKTTLVAEEVTGPDNSKRWKLLDVIGLEDGLGVECLSGSGAIAGAFSKAFREGFTITLVSGRTVGIGAYLARLGRRCASCSSCDVLYVKAICTGCQLRGVVGNAGAFRE